MSRAFVLVETTSESVCGGTMISAKMNGLLSRVTRPEGLVSWCGVWINTPPLPQNLQELRENIQAAWDGLSQDTIRNFYNSMLRRLAYCNSDSTFVCVAQ